ncbi:group III truncated hemoglobin [Taibaiella soli]|uniref:Globin n=1 Tax=Taibaiella soli TaxID=1649169 RepID=A0A2W2AGY7_9BACT|nr:group III truncated hemoglobin [Taibaiella soli]PZF74755.1 globin [Taibaiella soli]
MADKKDIATIEDVRILVDDFYTDVRADPLFGDIFNNILEHRWPQHLEKMYRFWQTVLLEEHTYQGSPFLPHAKMPLDTTHFSAWVSLWHRIVDKHFAGERAEEAKWRGNKMAVMFLSKIEYYREHPATPLL